MIPDRPSLTTSLISSAGRTVGVVVGAVAAYYLLPIVGSSMQAVLLRIVIGVGLTVAVAAWQVRAVVHSPRPTLQSIEAIAMVAALVVVTFATAYISLSERDPLGFNERLGRTAALYFTMTTLTTTGFGDINARSDAARIAVMVQMVVTVAILGSAIKLLSGAARLRRQQEVRPDRPADR